MNNQLVEGAARVAQAKASAKAGNLMASQAATATAAFLAEGMGKVIQKRNHEFNDIMKTQLGKEGLSDEEYQKLYKRFKQRRGAYVYLNKKERMDFEREIMEEAQDFKKNEADREEIAEIITDETNEISTEDIDDTTITEIVKGDIEPTKDENGRVGYALSSDALQEFVVKDENGNNKLKSYKASWEDDRFTVSKDGKYKTDKFGNKYSNDEAGFKDYQRSAKLYWIRKAKENGDKTLHYNSTTGKREYLDPEEAEALLNDEEKFVTVDEIKNHVKSRAKDNKAATALSTNIVSGAEKAKNLKPGDNTTFDRDEAYGRYIKVVESTDVHKLATKKMHGDTSFEQDLTEKLTTMQYGDLGISDDVVKQFDPTNDGKVSKQDAAVIVGKIMQDEKMLKGYLADYFTIYEEREFKNNIPQDLKQQALDDENEYA